MLQELRLENLLLMEHAELRLAPGLNVLTGETGAGKTLLAHALDLLLGGRARSGVVRGGASEAYVEGVFSAPPTDSGGEAATSAAELLPDGAEELVLARRVWPDGRTRAYVCGRSASIADLRELGGRLLAFYGQHEHRKLMLSSSQLEMLDSYCGGAQMKLRAQLADAYRQVHELEAKATQLRELAAARERELDLLAFELDEIERASPSEEEPEELINERERLRHVEALRSGAGAAAEAISPDGSGGASELLARGAQLLQSTTAIDPAVAALHQRLEALRYEVEDLGGELRAYALEIEGSPVRLEEVEERLALLARLQRRYGPSIAEVREHAERCRARREQLEHAEIELGHVESELLTAQQRLERLVTQLRDRRGQAAPKLAAAVRERLSELAMAEASFEIELAPRTNGCGPRGADVVELMIAPNAGIAAAPLREIASGGELSRVMLALLSIVHGQARIDDSQPLLVFDEIDAGIGGHTALAVGRHLRELASGRQILCITHLPQIAALAARHFTIARQPGTIPARTTVAALDGEGTVGEIVRMLGAAAGDRAASQHARSLLRAA